MQGALHRYFRLAHKWLGLIIGLQVLAWVFGGFLMSWMNIEEVHGDHLRKFEEPKPINFSSIIKLEDLSSEWIENAYSIELISNAYLTYYQIKTSDKLTHRLNAQTGLPLPLIDKASAEIIAKNYYVGSSPLKSIELLNEKTQEYKKEVPAWRANFDDDESASLYISATTGELQSVRNTQWRIFDFVWMLHIMDYKDREDFNHPLLIGAALLALFITFSGGYLVFKNFRRRDFFFITKRFKK